MKWSQKPYNNLAHHLETTFGSRLYKVALDCHLGCPNRDGTKGIGGCIFCSETGSGDFAQDSASSVTSQLQKGIDDWHAKHPHKTGRFIAYYQAFTNTYAQASLLEELYRPAMDREDVALLSIATRPDCIPDDVLDLLARMNTVKPVWVELGLQTTHDETAELINRGYPYSIFEETVHRLHEKGIDVIVHLILGLPGETLGDVLATIDAINKLPVQGVKLHLLHVLKGTELARMYDEGLFETLTLETYTDWICESIARLRPDIAIHRLTGDGPKDLLVAPMWSADKRKVLNIIHHKLKTQRVCQGVRPSGTRHPSAKGSDEV